MVAHSFVISWRNGQDDSEILDTYPPFDFCKECKGRTPTDCIIRYDEVDDSL
jgi:hypothetical protein